MKFQEGIMAQVNHDYQHPLEQVAPALGFPKTRSWFQHVGALLEALSSEPCLPTANDLKKHLLAIHQSISSDSGALPLETQRVDSLFQAVVAHNCPTARTQALFSSEEMGRLLPRRKDLQKTPSLHRQFIRDWIVPSMFKHYPGLEGVDKSPALKSWTANALLLSLSSKELQRLRDQVDGLPPEFSGVHWIGLKKILGHSNH